ncbi:uncharacterized protein [Dysidea avara]|uniref:uncharacterized protein isoform X2 n=1 Tax=Dysidea avara TaxID=196820 RepID=UPI00332CDDF2
MAYPVKGELGSKTNNAEEKPSDPSWKESNVFWLFKLSPSSKMKNVCRDQIKALEMWEDLLETSQVTEDKIREIAKATNFTSGKWLIRRPRDKIDETWKLIAEATVAGRLGHLAKVSTTKPSQRQSDNTHVICIYTEDYTNVEDVMRIRRELRSMGINELLRYKPDIYTIFDIYYNNPYQIKASVYASTGQETLFNPTRNQEKTVTKQNKVSELIQKHQPPNNDRFANSKIKRKPISDHTGVLQERHSTSFKPVATKATAGVKRKCANYATQQNFHWSHASDITTRQKRCCAWNVELPQSQVEITKPSQSHAEVHVNSNNIGDCTSTTGEDGVSSHGLEMTQNINKQEPFIKSSDGDHEVVDTSTRSICRCILM